MAKKKKYAENPYIDAVVGAISVCACEYGEAKITLEENPNDERAMVSKNFCTDFIVWLQETTGLPRLELLAMIIKMTEV
ncbi:MAG: hypothetical protein J6D57_06520 [Mogibacterium sp.]|nr:hypothetical protein [Mogibacterium sp.]